jgi:hypothetical protein
METNNSNTCFNCDKPYPAVGFFCGGCLTQLKCKSCNYPLEKDNLGCTNCGTPKDVKNVNETNLYKNVNTFKLHETSTDRTIEATFSDEVGKDLAGILRDTYSTKIGNTSKNKFIEDEIIYIEDQKADSEEAIIQKPIISNLLNAENQNLEINTDYPNLLSVSINNLPASEVEWVIVYSFYASDFGKNQYQRKDLLDQHVESQRKNKISNNLTANINAAVRSGFISPLKDSYFLVESGKQKAIEIISRTRGTTPKNNLKRTNENSSNSKASKPNNSPNKSAGKSLKRLTDLNLYPENKESLKVFYEKFQCKNDYEKILVFVYYLEEILKVVPITSNHIYTCYDDLNLITPQDLPQTVRSTKSKTGWLDGNNSGLSISIKGKNHIISWNKK